MASHVIAQLPEESFEFHWFHWLIATGSGWLRLACQRVDKYLGVSRLARYRSWLDLREWREWWGQWGWGNRWRGFYSPSALCRRRSDFRFSAEGDGLFVNRRRQAARKSLLPIGDSFFLSWENSIPGFWSICQYPFTISNFRNCHGQDPAVKARDNFFLFFFLTFSIWAQFEIMPVSLYPFVFQLQHSFLFPSSSSFHVLSWLLLLFCGNLCVKYQTAEIRFKLPFHSLAFY